MKFNSTLFGILLTFKHFFLIRRVALSDRRQAELLPGHGGRRGGRGQGRRGEAAARPARRLLHPRGGGHRAAEGETAVKTRKQ